MKISNIYKNITKYLFLSLGIIFSILILSCSSQGNSNSENTIPLAKPSDISVIGKNQELIVQFTKLGQIGVGTNKVEPTYDIFLSENPTLNESRDTYIGQVRNPIESRLVKFRITNSGFTQNNKEYNYNLKNNTKYYLFIRSNYGEYGKSEFAVRDAIPVGFAKPMTSLNLEVGDNLIYASWTKNEYEEYVVTSDCPKNKKHIDALVNDKEFWTVTDNFVTTDNYIVKFPKNEPNGPTSIKICAVSKNSNGYGDWVYAILDPKNQNHQIVTAKNGANYKLTFDGSSKDSINNLKAFESKASTKNPIKTEFSVESKNKRLELTFTPKLIGEDAASNYVIKYKKSTDTAAEFQTFNADFITLNDKKATVTLPNLKNNETYKVSIIAKNSFNSTGIESDIVDGTPIFKNVNLNDPNEVLGVAVNEFIFREDVPHSDFTRITCSGINCDKVENPGGRRDTDRLPRGKETAIGSLFSQGILEYAKEKNLNVDFSFLIGGMINSGLYIGQIVTPNVLKNIIDFEFLQDELVIVTLKGSEIISNSDLNIDVETPGKYPSLENINSLLGQTASVYRNAHYGGNGGSKRQIFNGKNFGIPSNNLKYTIQYKSYDINQFNTQFNANCLNYDKKAGTVGGVPYNGIQDAKGCYLLPNNQANPARASSDEFAYIGYKRGKIKEDSVKIMNSQGVWENIDLNKTYRVLTTDSIAYFMYSSLLGKPTQKTGIKFIDAIASYIVNKYTLNKDDYLTGKVVLEGGVPGNPLSDFSPKSTQE